MVCGRHGCGRHGHDLWPSWFVAVMVVAVMVMVCGLHGLWPSWLWPSWSWCVAVMVCGRHGIGSNESGVVVDGNFRRFRWLLRRNLQI